MTINEVSAEEQQQKVIDHFQKPLKHGDIWYVIPRSWWTKFCKYCGLNPNQPSIKIEEEKKENIKPGIISCESLIKKEFKMELKDDICEHEDYEIVHSCLYKDFESWGYISTNNKSLPRKVVRLTKSKKLIIELYPSFINVVRAKGGKIQRTQKVEIVSNYEKESLKDILQNICKNEQKMKNQENDCEMLDQDTEEEEIACRMHYLDMNPAKRGGGWKLIDDDEMEMPYSDLATPYKRVLVGFKNGGIWDFPPSQDKVCEEKGARRTFLENLTRGAVIDVRSQAGTWYEAKVLSVQEDLIEIRYTGDCVGNINDEEIPKTSRRLARKGKHTSSYIKRSNTHSTLWQRQNIMGKPEVVGAVGLRNLGNTCFMNSTLQCLSNTRELTKFFLNDVYKKEINVTNPLGWKGKIAISYADLIKEMWSNNYKVVAPSNFKRVIGEFQPRFSGYQQHDSSELLHFLLDGLHEDLNRVLDKPQTQQVESNGREDAVVAKEAWERHLKRNRSIIVDLCQGQLKSTVICPDCKKKSVTFDPYMFLSVPLPQEKTRPIQVTYKSLTGDPIVYSCLVPKEPLSIHVAESLSKIIGPPVTAENLVMKEVYNHSFWKEFKPTDSIQLPTKDDIWLFQIPENVEHFPLIHRSGGSVIITPTIISIPKEKTSGIKMEELRRLIKDCISPFMKGGWQPDDKDEDMYTIGLYAQQNFSDRDGTLDREIPYGDEIINFDNYEADVDVSIGLQWHPDAVKRLVDDKKKWPRHESAEVALVEKIKGLSLDDCFTEFTEKETLAESDAWYCNQCKKHQCAEKTIDLFSLPDILIIHLKRFHYDQYYRNKIDTMVDFPIEGLNMTEWISNKKEKTNCAYDLFAISNHMGRLGGGHYTAFTKNFQNNKWYHFDDCSVNLVENANATKTHNAYVLFYQRRKT